MRTHRQANRRDKNAPKYKFTNSANFSTYEICLNNNNYNNPLLKTERKGNMLRCPMRAIRATIYYSS